MRCTRRPGTGTRRTRRSRAAARCATAHGIHTAPVMQCMTAFMQRWSVQPTVLELPHSKPVRHCFSGSLTSPSSSHHAAADLAAPAAAFVPTAWPRLRRGRCPHQRQRRWRRRTHPGAAHRGGPLPGVHGQGGEKRRRAGGHEGGAPARRCGAVRLPVLAGEGDGGGVGVQVCEETMHAWMDE